MSAAYSAAIDEILKRSHEKTQTGIHKRIRREGIAISRKDAKRIKEQQAVMDRIAVRGVATIRHNGGITTRTVRHPDVMPKWWNRAQPDQRRDWLIACFKRQLHFDTMPGAELISVEFKI